MASAILPSQQQQDAAAAVPPPTATSAAAAPNTTASDLLPPPPAVTLSFGGVDFRLTPDPVSTNNADGTDNANNANNAALVSVLQHLGGGSGASSGMTLNLCNFTGTLRVTHQPHQPHQPSSMGGETRRAVPSGAGVVEEEPDTPPTQQQQQNQNQRQDGSDDHHRALLDHAHPHPTCATPGIIATNASSSAHQKQQHQNKRGTATPSPTQQLLPFAKKVGAVAGTATTKGAATGSGGRTSNNKRGAKGGGKITAAAAKKKNAAKRLKPTLATAGRAGRGESRSILAKMTRRRKEEEEEAPPASTSAADTAAAAAAAAAVAASATTMTPTLGQQLPSQSTAPSQSTGTEDYGGGDAVMMIDDETTGADENHRDVNRGTTMDDGAQAEEDGGGEEEAIAIATTERKKKGPRSVQDILDEAERKTQSAEDFDDDGDNDGNSNDNDADDDDDQSVGDNGESAIMEIDDADDVVDDGAAAGSKEKQHDRQEQDDEEEATSEAETETIPASSQAAAAAVTTLSTSTSLSAPTQKGKHRPCPRWGQTMTLIDHGRVLVYGGQAVDAESDALATLSDLHVYDVCTRKWSKPVNCDGVRRTWHSATFLPERQLLISFGGEGFNPKTNKVETTQEVMVLDTEIMLWYPPSVSGSIPSGRSGHTASLLPNTNELVVFGGVKNRKWQNSVAVLDTTRWKWTVPKITGSAPRPRSYHTATAVGGCSSSGSRNNKASGRLVIFGGNDESESFDSVHVLDGASDNSKMSWFHPKVTGTAPRPRSGHVAALLEDGKTILIYGGWDLNAEEEEDSAAASSSNDDEEMIFEDSYLLDTELWSWSPGPKAKYVGGGAPNGGAKRVGHSAVLAPSEEGPAQVLVFGGRIPNDEFASDFQKLAVPQSDVKLG